MTQCPESTAPKPRAARRAALLLLCAGLLSACVGANQTVEPQDPSTIPRVVGAGPDLIRIWGDATPQEIARDKDAIAQRVIARLGDRPRLDHAQYLVLSGGGTRGAFAAGLLGGWSEAGTRPRFEIVTGVSTGALIAPFAFLGPAYDETIRSFYLDTTAGDVVAPVTLAGLFGGRALTSTQPLQANIERHLTMEVMEAIAREYENGRYLLIGTTNLAVGRPVIWDMGAIAARRDEAALALFHKVILASASIPVLFPPVFIDVETGGKITREVHVDGGTTDNAIIAPLSLSLRDILPVDRSPRRETIYVVINGRLQPSGTALRPNMLGIARRSIFTLLREQTKGDIRRLEAFAASNNITMRMASIPDDFSQKEEGTFDRAFMDALYDYGYGLGKSEIPWQTPSTRP